MPISQRYTIMCDDVRQENNGKLIYIGVYTPNIAAPQIPITLPALTFLQVLDTDRPGNYTFRMRLVHLESGHQVVEAMGAINFIQPGMGINVVRFGNVVFDRLGTYNLSLTIEDHRDPMLFSFDVVLGPQPQQQPGR